MDRKLATKHLNLAASHSPRAVANVVLALRNWLTYGEAYCPQVKGAMEAFLIADEIERMKQ